MLVILRAEANNIPYNIKRTYNVSQFSIFQHKTSNVEETSDLEHRIGL